MPALTRVRSTDARDGTAATFEGARADFEAAVINFSKGIG
jgi:hypothetical protein